MFEQVSGDTRIDKKIKDKNEGEVTAHVPLRKRVTYDICVAAYRTLTSKAIRTINRTINQGKQEGSMGALVAGVA